MAKIFSVKKWKKDVKRWLRHDEFERQLKGWAKDLDGKDVTGTFSDIDDWCIKREDTK